MPTVGHIHTNYIPSYGHLGPCTESQCPLTRAGMQHSQGIYRHGGKDNGDFNTVFGTSNPPPFVWQAEERRIAAKKRLEAGDETARTEMAESAGVVDRFLDNHCECAFCPH